MTKSKYFAIVLLTFLAGMVVIQQVEIFDLQSQIAKTERQIEVLSGSVTKLAEASIAHSRSMNSLVDSMRILAGIKESKP